MSGLVQVPGELGPEPPRQVYPTDVWIQLLDRLTTPPPRRYVLVTNVGPERGTIIMTAEQAAHLPEAAK